MRKPLAICADFVLTFDDQHAAIAQYAQSFPSRLKIKIGNCLMPLGAVRLLIPIGVEFSKGGMRPRSSFLTVFSTVKPFHVGWVKHNTINRSVRVRQVPAIHAIGYVGCF